MERPGFTPAREINRWKLVSLVLAGCMAYSWFGDARSPSGMSVAHARLEGPLGAKTATMRMSTDELVRALFTTKDVVEFRQLAERLGVIGNDDAIDEVRELLDDPRDGVPEALLAAFGAIATEHAVDVLIKSASDPRDSIRIAAIEALGATRNRRAEPVLVEVALRNDDDAQNAAIDALAELGSERAVGVLAQLAAHPSDIGGNAMRALATIDTAEAKSAVIALIDSPNLTVAVNAIGSVKEVDGELVAIFADIVKTADRELVVAALGALAKAGEAGLPALEEAARDGAIDVRVAAIAVMVDVQSPRVLATLKTILETEDGRVAEAAAGAIASIDSDEAREALISAALSDQAGTTRAVEFLMRQTGPEVEQALLVIAKSDSKSRWDAVQHLVRAGNADALAYAVGQARSGTDETVKLAAMEAIANAGGQPAADALIELVRTAGDLKPRALAILGDARPDDPVVAKMLHESVQSNDPAEAAAAASALAKVGTEEARDALVAALRSSDAEVARNAAASLSKFKLTDEVTAAMRSAIASHPELKTQVMQQLISGGAPLGFELAKQALTEMSNDTYRVIGALEQSGTPAAFDVLAQAARSQDAQLRAEVIASIGSIADKRAPELISHALRDDDINVRTAAIRTLGNMGTTQARDQIITVTRSQSVDDRRMAAVSLRRFDDATATRRLTELIRDPDVSVASYAIDSVADRTEAQSVLRSLVLDSNVPRYTRREAARALSYRGVTDPTIEDLLATYDTE